MWLVVVLGAKGMLGSYLYSYFSRRSPYGSPIDRKSNVSVMPVTRKEFQVTEGKAGQEKLNNLCLSIHEWKKKNGCDKVVILNAIGLVNSVFSPKEEFFLVNGEFPGHLADVCEKNHWKLVHFSTDCVFSGKKEEGKGYLESDEPDAQNVYGKSKRAGELAVGYRGTVIRCSIIGRDWEHRRGFIEFVCRSDREKPVQGYTNHLWNGVTCAEYARFIDEYLLERELFWKGVRHVIPGYVVSKFEMCEIVGDVYNYYGRKLIVDKVKTIPGKNMVLATEHPIPEDVFKFPSLAQQIKNLIFFNMVKLDE